MPERQEQESQQCPAPPTDESRSQEHRGAGQSVKFPVGRVLVRDALPADGGMWFMLTHSCGYSWTSWNS